MPSIAAPHHFLFQQAIQEIELQDHVCFRCHPARDRDAAMISMVEARRDRAIAERLKVALR